LTAFDLHNEMQKINNLTSVVTIEGAIETDLEAEADL
jgi:hypothetical protein